MALCNIMGNVTWREDGSYRKFQVHYYWFNDLMTVICYKVAYDVVWVEAWLVMTVTLSTTSMGSTLTLRRCWWWGGSSSARHVTWAEMLVVGDSMLPAFRSPELVVLPTELRPSPWLLLMFWGMGSPASPGPTKLDSMLNWLSQGWEMIEASVARVSVSTLRHCLIRSWHSADTRYRNRTSATQIWSSVSKGISPHTISKRRIPRDQTVASSPLYLFCLIHSGGA